MFTNRFFPVFVILALAAVFMRAAQATAVAGQSVDPATLNPPLPSQFNPTCKAVGAGTICDLDSRIRPSQRGQASSVAAVPADLRSSLRRRRALWKDNTTMTATERLDPANLKGIRDDMDLYDRIRDKVSGLVSVLKDMNTLTPEMHQDSDFSHVYKALEKRLKENPSSPEAETKNGAPSPTDSRHLGENVTGTNGSIDVGKIHVGVNVDGNIVIGNNNQVNSDKKK